MIPLRSVRLFTALIAFPAATRAADINGTPGPDVLEGTTEDDRINGLGGNDTMMGLPGNDTYIVGQAGDEVLEAVGDGTDTIRSTVSYALPIHVENLTLAGAAAIDGTGNALANRITGNGAANTLNGRAGADRMFGRGGNDTFIVDAAGDIVNEAPGGGIDAVRSTVTHTLRPNVENLVLIGNAAVNGTGNELANSLRGNGAANILNGREGDDTLGGGAGNDRLVGGPGNDQLSGGPGEDAFQFDAPLDAATNQDRILDFNPAADVMRLIGATFPELSAEGTLPASAFANGIVASGAAVRILYDPATGNLRYDGDGSGPGDSIRFGRLVNTPAISNTDFTVIDPVATAVDYSEQIQPIFSSRCTECHSGSGAPQGLRLDTANSYANLVGVASREVPSLQRVEPGNPDDSYLVQKVEGTAAVGGRMPLGRTPLTAAQIALIRQWISEGAER